MDRTFEAPVKTCLIAAAPRSHGVVITVATIRFCISAKSNAANERPAKNKGKTFPATGISVCEPLKGIAGASDEHFRITSTDIATTGIAEIEVIPARAILSKVTKCSPAESFDTSPWNCNPLRDGIQTAGSIERR